MPTERYTQFHAELTPAQERQAHILAEWSGTHNYTDSETQQNIVSRVTGAPQGEEQFVIAEVGMPFSDDPSRPYQFFDAPLSILAKDSLGKMPFIIRVGNPGIDHLSNGEASELTDEQKRELHTGSFKSIGQLCARALASTLEKLHLENKNIILLQRSMSVSSGASAVQQLVERGFTIKGVAYTEGVSYRPWHQPTLLAHFISSGLDAKKYLGQNPEICKGNDENLLRWLYRLSQDGATNLHYGRALAKNGFSEDQGDLSVLRDADVPILFKNGESSILSPGAVNDRVADTYDKAGVKVERYEWPHDANHPLTMTLGNDLDSIRRLVQP